MAGGTHYTQLGQKQEFFSIIHVTYPPGDICTCSNGIQILSASDSSGTYIFLLPTNGAWNILLNGVVKTTITATIKGTRFSCNLTGG